jgi:haloacid dehalogenase-like hydrolase
MQGRSKLGAMKLFTLQPLVAIWRVLSSTAMAIWRALRATFEWLARPFWGHPRLTWMLTSIAFALWWFEAWLSGVYDPATADPTTLATFWVGFGFWIVGTAVGPTAIRIIDRKVVGGTEQDRERARRITVIVQLIWLLATLVIWLFVGSHNGFTSVAAAHGALASLALLPSFALSFILRQRGLRDYGRDIDVILLNKTGTLTTGQRQYVFANLAVGSELSGVRELLALAAGLDPEKRDDLAKALHKEIRRRRLKAIEFKDHIDMPGLALSGRLDGSRYVLGGPELLVAHNTKVDVVDLMHADAANTQGQTVLYLLKDGALCGYMGFADELRPDVGFFVQLLQYRRKRVVIYSGDAHETTKYYADQLGCEEFYGEVLPHQHDALLQKISADGSTIFESNDVAAAALQGERAVRDRRFQHAAVLVALIVPGLSLIGGVIRLIVGARLGVMVPAIMASAGLNVGLLLIEISHRIWHRIPKTILAAPEIETEADD